MNRLIITPAKRRFGRRPRKQWQWVIKAENGQRLDPRDTYANVDAIIDAVQSIREPPLEVEVHYQAGIRTYQL